MKIAEYESLLNHNYLVYATAVSKGKLEIAAAATVTYGKLLEALEEDGFVSFWVAGKHHGYIVRNRKEDHRV